MKTLIHIAGALAITLASHGATAQNDLSPSDVIGKFADVGYVGPYAGEKTMSEAHSFCMRDMSDSRLQYDGNMEGDFYNAYRDCMKQYVPFRTEGQGEPGACDLTEVTWGQCSGTVSALANGQTSNVIHAGSDDYQGHALFRCEAGVTTYQSGGCQATVDACEAGMEVFWGVTTPLWADASQSTVYLDKYGQPRHSPKPACGAKMPAAPSGKLVSASATVPETSPAARYDIASATSAQRCFNNEFIHEQQASDHCEYIPRGCAATTYTHPSGCSYNIPAGNHDQIFRSSSPAPQNSVGSLEAYCFDGEWEIKSATCTPSCAPSLPAYSWAADYGSQPPATPKQCQHSQIVQANRIPPSTSLRVDNETKGMDGEAVYVCDAGTIKRTGEQCVPETCDGIPANSWGNSEVCSHDRIDTTLLHGEDLTIRQGTPFSGISEIEYVCEYGKLEVKRASCNTSAQCSSAFDSSCVCDATPSPSSPKTCDSGVTMQKGGSTFCCETSGNSTSCRKL